MLNFDDLRLKINPLYEGEELVNKLLILPEVDTKALSKGEKLFKLLELYKIFIPNKKIEVIYNNLYLSFTYLMISASILSPAIFKDALDTISPNDNTATSGFILSSNNPEMPI